MGLNIAKGSTVSIYRFENAIKDKQEKITHFRTYLSKKNEDETFSKYSLEVRFGKDLKEQAAKGLKENVRYDIEIEEGFVTFDEYKIKDVTIQKAVLVVTKAKVKAETPVEKKSTNLF